MGIGMKMMHNCASIKYVSVIVFKQCKVNVLHSNSHLNSLVAEIWQLLNRQKHLIYVNHMLIYERSGIIKPLWIWIPWRSNGKVVHVMTTVWMCHMPICDVAIMQEIESKFRTNMATIQRNVASKTWNHGIRYVSDDVWSHHLKSHCKATNAK